MRRRMRPSLLLLCTALLLMLTLVGCGGGGTSGKAKGAVVGSGCGSWPNGGTTGTGWMKGGGTPSGIVGTAMGCNG